MYDYTSYSIW